MHTLAQLAVILILLNNFALLATGNMKMLIRLTAAQGFLLALLLLVMPVGQDFAHTLFFCLAVLGIKGLCFPWLLGRIVRQAIKTPQLTPRFGYNLSLLAGVLALVFSLWLETRLPLASGFFPFLMCT
jgi:hydrogenase-4 component E